MIHARLLLLLALLGAACTSGRIASEDAAAAAPAVTPPSPVPSPSLPARYDARIDRIGPDVRAQMGTSWRRGCPVPLRDLRVLRVRHWGFDGAVHEGEMIVHRRWSTPVAGVFRSLFEARFPIERMEPANGYLGDDPPLAQRNNTVGFNCRASVGSPGRWSEHAYGRAIDVNPDQNPYVSPSGRIEPRFGRPYVDRSRRAPGMIRPGDAVVRAFERIGWRWGGDYRRSKDYMHFSATGR